MYHVERVDLESVCVSKMHDKCALLLTCERTLRQLFIARGLFGLVIYTCGSDISDVTKKKNVEKCL